MKNQITYLELLEMIRDDKQPKKVYWDEDFWVWDKRGKNYYLKTENAIDKTIDLFAELTFRTIPINLITEKCIEF